MNTDDEMLTPDEMVARYKGKLKKGTLANWRSSKKGPAYLKLNGRVMYPLQKVKEWEDRSVRLSE